MKKLLQDLFEKRVNQYVSFSRDFLYPKAERKKEACANRSAEIVKVMVNGKIIEKISDDVFNKVKYQAHFQYLIKQKNQLYIEEEVEVRVATFYKDSLILDEEIAPEETMHDDRAIIEEADDRLSYEYDRLQVVQYAERWWNDYNPAYKKFEVDCTNFISQCLHTGGGPMSGYPNRGKGWWLRDNNWSYSWAVANSLRIYLANPQNNLRAKEVKSPDQLLLGDVICYDFEGDGRFNHNTVVTGKDAFGMPLVNAHTYNSRKRYWAYEDSTAYTPNIKYKFFTINGGR
ncbi:MAG: amidase domain-containing protein [Bacillota bacterium]|nr:amidase domain-containing protein [Bacillota bacterium]